MLEKELADRKLVNERLVAVANERGEVIGKLRKDLVDLSRQVEQFKFDILENCPGQAHKVAK